MNHRIADCLILQIPQQLPSHVYEYCYLKCINPHMLNPKYISDLFEFKSTSYSIRNNVKVQHFGVELHCTNIEILDHPVSYYRPV